MRSCLLVPAPDTAPRGTSLQTEIIHLYEAESDLLDLPQTVFAGVQAIVDADVVTFTEVHGRTGEFRSLMSLEDEPQRRMAALQAYASHMHSHPFWRSEPEFFGDNALRESDFFSDEEFMQLPMAQAVFLPSGARRIMAIVMTYHDHLLRVTALRVIGRSPFSDRQRNHFKDYRAHLLRNYRQAQERTLAKLTPADRLRLAFPQLTPRQFEVASLLTQGKSNEDMAAILRVGIDTIKAHVKAVYEKLGVDGRLATAIAAYTAAPFAQLPPLWKLHPHAWSPTTGNNPHPALLPA